MPLRNIFAPFLDQPPEVPFVQRSERDASAPSARGRTTTRNVAMAIAVAATLGQSTVVQLPTATYETIAMVSSDAFVDAAGVAEPDVWLGRALNKAYSLQVAPQRDVDELPNDIALQLARELLESLAEQQLKPECIAASIYGGIDVYFSAPGRALAFECLNSGKYLVHGTRYDEGAPWIAKIEPKYLDTAMRKAMGFLNG